MNENSAPPPSSDKETMIMPAPAFESSSNSGVRKGERRRQFRSVMSTDVAVRFTWEGRTFHCRLRDSSPAGAGLVIAEPDSVFTVPPGSIVDLHFAMPGDEVRRQARLTTAQLIGKCWRLGFAFTGEALLTRCLGALDMDRVKIDPAWALRLSPSLALRRQVLPFAADDKFVYVACREEFDASIRQSLEKTFGMPVRVEIAEPESLKRMLDRVYGDWQNSTAWQQRSRSVDVRSSQEIQPEDIVGVCDELMHAAILRQASDIHIDPEPACVHVRFRVDGVLDTYRRLPASAHNAIISRFKVVSGMDISEKRAPQDGGFTHKFGRGLQSIDIRSATLPTRHGERMTIRLLALQTGSLTLEKLGMSSRDLAIFEQAIDRPHGMILLTGPTGSGKSTTLYAAIRRILERESLNIITVEDPIEYEILGVAQTEVDQADKVTFVKALRSVLRHDPDVVMIGEIRDAETADVAIKASLTGHLVFSTLHTNSAASVVTRLTDMGVDRFLIAATLRLAVAQRLVRQLCPRCRSTRPLAPSEAIALQRPDAAQLSVHDQRGCIYCGKRGFVGRVGLFEMLPVDDDLARLIANNIDEATLLQTQHDKGMLRLVDDGFEKIALGITSVREVLGAVTVW